jgi:mono/diheme cytochrome c family protein
VTVAALTRRTAVCLVFLALTQGSVTVLAQTPSSAPPPRSARGGVYTAEQAREGMAIFEQQCSRCHSAQEYRSPRFQTKWTSRTLHELYLVISTTMPFDQPASLQPRQYAELISFILEVNGFPPGPIALGWEEKALAAITLDPPP